MEPLNHQHRSRAQAEADFVPQLNRESQLSLEKQFVRAVREAIGSGRLRPGMRLPSSRRFAAELQVNRNTVVHALYQLVAEGYLTSHPGSGTFVSETIPRSSALSSRTSPSLLLQELPPLPEPAIPARFGGALVGGICQPSTATFPLAHWRKAWRQATRHVPSPQYGDPAGEAGLRAAVADYLAHARGLRCSPDDLLITSGATQAFALVAQALLAPGMAVACEEPGYPLARQVFAHYAARLLLVPVDPQGLRVEHLHEGPMGPRLVYVTPSHQFPLGVRLSAARRMALLEWATRQDAFILEDDYDSEFRYDAPPLPPLASLESTGRVIYVGTFSKALSPNLRIGYVLAPLLREQLRRLKCWMDYHPNTQVQLALEYFLKEGYFAQHLRRMRRLYAEKRAALVQALAPVQAVASVCGLEAGLHAFVECDAQVPIEPLVQRCLRQGILLMDLSRYYAAEPTQRGVVLGYGGLERPEIAWIGKQIVAQMHAQSQEE
jgi:GntR family transcriptional regulator / MocR family aminotransferase